MTFTQIALSPLQYILAGERPFTLALALFCRRDNYITTKAAQEGNVLQQNIIQVS